MPVSEDYSNGSNYSFVFFFFKVFSKAIIPWLLDSPKRGAPHPTCVTTLHNVLRLVRGCTSIAWAVRREHIESNSSRILSIPRVKT